ncbi:MAG: peptidylprolyl isomerase [Planctomycetota bacterium]
MRSTKSLLLTTLPLIAAACGGGHKLPRDLKASIAALQARPEHTADSVEVQHILIAFQGAMRSTATRSKEEAEKLTAEVYGRAWDGDDFTSLMKTYTGDPGPGTYPMTKDGRAGMVPTFGNVAWRLEVGEIGVGPFDPKDSPFGWHIIKRLK